MNRRMIFTDRKIVDPAWMMYLGGAAMGFLIALALVLAA